MARPVVIALALSCAVGCGNGVRPTEAASGMATPTAPAAPPGAVSATPSPPRDARMAPGLLWNIADVLDNRRGPVSVSWVDAGGAVQWTVPLPESLRFSVCCRDAKTDRWLSDQRENGYSRYWNVQRIEDTIAIEDGGELLVLDVASGATRFEWRDERTREERNDTFSEAVIDEGTVTITHGEVVCEEAVSRQSFMVMCKGALVLFDRGVLARFDGRPLRLAGRVEARGPKLAELSGNCPGPLSLDVDKTFEVGAIKVRFVGRRVTTCRT